MRKILILSIFLLTVSVSMAVNPTGTLPIVHVYTVSGLPVTDKENYVAGKIYIDNVGAGQSPLGTAAVPLDMEIRGRGNWTWLGFDKKPYKIKLGKSSPVLGMPKSKHWALMAAADDHLGFLRNTVGFMLGQYIGLKWTPHQVPVELVLNDDYQGIYFLTETIRIQKNRVNIDEQPDNNTDPNTLKGGWLLEIDNYEEEGQVVVEEPNGQLIRISIHTPDSVNELQRHYLQDEMDAVNEAFYRYSSKRWEQLVNLDELAKFYLVQEIIENTESFHGSCYFYRDKGTNDKWCFGPVWDFGNAYWRHQEQFIYENPSFSQIWIGQVATFPAFQHRVMELWHQFITENYQQLRTDISAFSTTIAAAATRDAERWANNPNVWTNPDIPAITQVFLDDLSWRVGWLTQQWGQGIAPIDLVPGNETPNRAVKTLQNGQLVIIRDGVRYTLTGQRID